MMQNFKSMILYCLLRIFFHVSLIVIYIYTSYFIATRSITIEGPLFIDENTESPISSFSGPVAPIPGLNHSDPDNFGGSWRYLTTWNYTFQVLFFSMSISLDIWLLFSYLIKHFRSSDSHDTRGTMLEDYGLSSLSEPVELPPSIAEHIVDILFHSILFPLGVYVFIAFWTIFLYDRELVFPKFLDKMFPWWVNQVMHSLILIAAIGESLLVHHPPPAHRTGLAIECTLNLVYTLWILYLGAGRQIWAYPFLSAMNWPQRILMLGGSFLMCIPLYIFGVVIHNRYWSHVHQSHDHREYNRSRGRDSLPSSQAAITSCHRMNEMENCDLYQI